jgi:hypothetical protein
MFFAAPPDRALGAAFVLHAISFLPVTILGALFMVSEGLTLTGVRRLAESAPVPAPGEPAEADQAAPARSGPSASGAPVAESPRYEARAHEGRAAVARPGKRSAR